LNPIPEFRYDDPLMRTFSVHTLGCKVNQYESQQIRQVLEQSGLKAAGRRHPPDLVVINTCCVTQNASTKSRQNIRKVIKAHPNAIVVVAGCLPAGQEQEVHNLHDVIIVKDKDTLSSILELLPQKPVLPLNYSTYSKPTNILQSKDKNPNLTQQTVQRGLQKTSHGIEKLPLLTRFSGQSRAFLKIQDGCDAYCTYCIIPKIRTHVRNKPAKSILKEAQNLVHAGHREIILTGIFLGAYGQKTARRKNWDPGKLDSLAKLVDQVALLEGLLRLRLSSLEPLDVTDRLLEIMAAHDNIAPHLHLPLQSGSANILRKMARQYTIDDYLRVVEKVQKVFDRPAITTDIIVGFPGETDDDFDQSVKLAKQIGFSRIHVFSFSVRKNTPAEKMAKLFGKVSPQEIKRRSSILQAVDAELQDQFRQSCSGIEETVLIEKTRPPRGRCSRYFMVDVQNNPDADALQKGQVVKVTISEK
jgi:threonylcarbamoyladenosine tRNA methylthiotransferase MtaB